MVCYCASELTCVASGNESLRQIRHGDANHTADPHERVLYVCGVWGREISREDQWSKLVFLACTWYYSTVYACIIRRTRYSNRLSR